MLIKNIRLETGFETIAPGDIQTQTALFHLKINHDKIEQIIPAQDPLFQALCSASDPLDVYDAQGFLALPLLQDNHIHLDKGHFGGPWKASIPMGSVAERIVEEEGFLRSFLPETPKKAQALIDLITGYGAGYLKVQVNVDPVSKLDNLHCIHEVLEQNKDKLDYDLVAFPQHGTLKTQSLGLLEEALKEGVPILGGLDPASIDGDIDTSFKTSFDLAAKYNCSLDFHLHTGGNLGLFEIQRLIYFTHNYQMDNKVSISHGLSLGDLDLHTCKKLAEDFSQLGIHIHTTAPIGRPAPPFMFFMDQGVTVNIVNDNINDHWSPFGTGDLLTRGSRGAEIFGINDEFRLSRVLKNVTGGITPLDDQGQQIWPKKGDSADVLLINAQCSAHAMARFPQERRILRKGKWMTPKKLSV